MLHISLSLLLAITGEARYRTTNLPRYAIRDSASQIAELALGFLALALAFLANPFLLQALGAEEVTNHFLARADGLVPRALGAVRVVLGNGAAAGDGEGAYVRAGMGGFLLQFRLRFFLLALGL